MRRVEKTVELFRKQQVVGSTPTTGSSIREGNRPSFLLAQHPPFCPDAEIRTLRTLARYRAELIERRAPHINHMIQALKHMNIQLNLVLTDITGVSGLAMLRAILAGERDPQQLAVFRQPGCKHSEAEIVKSFHKGVSKQVNEPPRLASAALPRRPRPRMD